MRLKKPLEFRIILEFKKMLHNIQRDFKGFIESKSVGDSLMTQVVLNGLPIDKRLGIYFNNIIGNLTESLRITYPNFVKLVGEEFFDFLASKYIPGNLPQCGVLHKYGQSFPGFVESVPQLEQYPYARDFATMEWIYHSCRHKLAEQILTLNKLAEIAAQNPGYEPKLKESVIVFESIHPIYQLWSMCENTTEEEELKNQAESVVIFQGLKDVELMKVDAMELVFIKSLMGADVECNISIEEMSAMLRKYIELGAFKA